MAPRLADTPPPAPLADEVAALAARNDALHQALIARDALAHKTAHDLRTPLNTMSGLLHLMQVKFAPELPDKALEYLDYMSRAVTQMDDMIAAFGAQARGSDDPTRPEPVDMRTVVDAVLAGFDGLAARVDVTGPDWTVSADPAVLRLLLGSVLRNAVQLADPARPFRVTITLDTTPDGTRRLRVLDNGRGVAPGDANAIVLARRSLTDGTWVAGGGLATCRAICARHGWRISAHADDKCGAGFDILFPDDDAQRTGGF